MEQQQVENGISVSSPEPESSPQEEVAHHQDEVKTEALELVLSASYSVTEGLEEEEDADLICRFCNDLFKKPITLACGWSYCQECLARNATRREDGRYDIYCPHCATELAYSTTLLYVNHYLNGVVERKRRLMESRGNCCHECGGRFRSPRHWFVCNQCSTQESELLICAFCLATKHSKHETSKPMPIDEDKRQAGLSQLAQLVYGVELELCKVRKERQKVVDQYDDYEKAASHFLGAMRRTQKVFEKSPYLRQESADRVLAIRKAQSDVITKTYGARCLPRAERFEPDRIHQHVTRVPGEQSTDGVGREINSLFIGERKRPMQRAPVPSSDHPKPPPQPQPYNVPQQQPQANPGATAAPQPTYSYPPSQYASPMPPNVQADSYAAAPPTMNGHSGTSLYVHNGRHQCVYYQNAQNQGQQ
ncbi:hypothetical protein QR680_004908 [Steinernema hermaphroditum]|uniref:RING-type domain-containing protein n=1 Tax=Steinernema hermaphroditum TaxID=289476 RepID=A0AA39HRG0_9BILA|nr:hypothetical protein QR680_004908 [Steinernema hermaphroditum]